MVTFELSCLQKVIMRKLWAIRDNFGPNIIQLAMSLRMKSRICREVIFVLPIDVEGVKKETLDINSRICMELFENNFIEKIAGQGGRFICIGCEGEKWCLQDERNVEV